MAQGVVAKIVDAYRGEAQDLAVKISAMLLRANKHGEISVTIQVRERLSASKVTEVHAVTVVREF